MTEMCLVTKVNYSVIFLILLFLIIFSLVRDKIFKKMENFSIKNKNKVNKPKNKQCPTFIESLKLIIVNVFFSGKIFPTKEDTKEKLQNQIKNIKTYCRYERVNILSKYYLLVVKDKLSLF